ncbi:hypothetical protein [Nonomuraea sp. SYSU D8015]|nr:hypothetical protein [Nonomuraea sp. SYSU D8015]
MTFAPVPLSSPEVRSPIQPRATISSGRVATFVTTLRQQSSSAAVLSP